MSQQHHYNLRFRGEPSEQLPPPLPPPTPPQHPQPTTRPRRISSPQRCSICLDTLSSKPNTALFLPCTHSFDLPCSITLLTGPPSPQTRQCPLCRAPITAVQYNFLSSPETSSIHIPGSPTFNSGPFIRDDETVSPGMSELESNRRRELRRLRLLPDYDPALWQLFHMGCFVREGENLEKVVLVERMISLKVMQLAGTKTVALLIRSLSIKAVDKGMIEEIDDEGESPKDVEEAREEVKNLLKGVDDRFLGQISRSWDELEVKDSELKVLRDEKGLEATVKKILMVERKSGVENITITDCTSLTEIFPTTTPLNWDGDDFDSDTNLVSGKSKTARSRAVSLARQEIQGVFDLFRVLSSFEDLRDLDRGSSSIMEIVNQDEIECEYCDQKHRNGDCKLPDARDIIGNVRVDRMQM
ncbi:hypothetical protein BDZ45DRAFT_795323 [Acephala macrosclerotiorum]|nr:hypothetical protein BDZ45DRAFT_795323 [Acephala macrosclerotiorum]